VSAASLSGSLAGIDLHSVVRLLANTGQTGGLRVSHGRWSAHVYFDRGRPVGASFGDARGLAALEALALALPHGKFEFIQDGPRGAHDLVGDSATLTAFLDRLRALRERLGLPKHFLDAIPRQIQAASEPDGAGQIEAERRMLLTLAAVNERRTVEEIAALRGTPEAVVEVAALVEMGLVRLDAPRSAARRWLAREGRAWLRPVSLAVVAISLLAANAWHERAAVPDPGPAVAAGAPEAADPGKCEGCAPMTVRVPNGVP